MAWNKGDESFDPYDLGRYDEPDNKPRARTMASETITYDDLCGLSRVFNAHNNAFEIGEITRINAWLSGLIESNRPVKRVRVKCPRCNGCGDVPDNSPQALSGEWSDRTTCTTCRGKKTLDAELIETEPAQ